MTSLKRQRCEIMEDRKKKPRFSEKEIELLFQGVKERSDIINSKFSDVINNSKKKQAWFEVMEAVNAVSFSTRTVDELKKKWDDVKRGTKKRASAVHKERCKTGSGKLDILPLSSMEEDIVSVMGEERIFGFSSYVDTMIPLTPSKAFSGEISSQDGQGVPVAFHTPSKAISGESPSQDGQGSQGVTLNTPKGGSFTECTSSDPLTVTKKIKRQRPYREGNSRLVKFENSMFSILFINMSFKR
uniref:Myb/SANT-like DNA-binding domain-containing protein n=1 Tax=Magallana gigas TaxID=29159 RepID=A0A8W8JL80_MAGGI